MSIKGSFGVVIGIMLLTGCGTTNLRVVKSVSAPPKAVSLQIIDESPLKMSEEIAVDFREILKAGLRDEGIQVVADGESAMSVVGVIKSFTPGVRAFRHQYGGGLSIGTSKLHSDAGAAKIRSTWTLLDGAKEELGRCKIDGKLSDGFYGGSLDNMLKDVAEDVADFVKGAKQTPAE